MRLAPPVLLATVSSPSASPRLRAESVFRIPPSEFRICFPPSALFPAFRLPNSGFVTGPRNSAVRPWSWPGLIRFPAAPRWETRPGPPAPRNKIIVTGFPAPPASIHPLSGHRSSFFRFLAACRCNKDVAWSRRSTISSALSPSIPCADLRSQAYGPFGQSLPRGMIDNLLLSFLGGDRNENVFEQVLFKRHVCRSCHQGSY